MTAFITGVSGQDGSYLAEFLVERGVDVIGLVRRQTSRQFENIEHIRGKITLVEGDITDQRSIEEILQKHKPHEVYNLASQSFAPISVSRPYFTSLPTALGVTSILDAISRICPSARFFQASSSEMFGEAKTWPQNERTEFNPRNPYGVSKLYGHYMARYYREQRGLFACSGIMYNHESPRRGEEFVTRKVTKAVARISSGLQSELRLGNLNAKRDWGHARDYAQAMVLMLESSEPRDYIISSGELHSVLDLCRTAFATVDLLAEDYIAVDPEFYRPDEDFSLLGDYSKIKSDLMWEPETSFESMVQEMVLSDIERTEKKL